MIIEEAKNNVITIGETEQNKVSIDVKNINFITTLLSSNLYSNPEQSFLREIVSNAWDSHIEAGNTDQPVVITVEENRIAIRDYGVGLSPERFKDIYLNIGSSTKREDNTQIGGFGIGRFSALACSNMVSIISYYEGVKYEYLMMKSGNTINIDLINSSNTTEHNGVEVSINLGYNKFTPSDFKYLLFFPNVYVNCKKSDLSAFNNVKVKRNTYYSLCEKYGYKSYYHTYKENGILLGNVMYPLDIYKIEDDELNTFMNNIEGLFLNFNIGDLEVTPNREQLIYSTKTIAAIKRVWNLAKKEITDHIQDVVNNNKWNIKNIIQGCHYSFNIPLHSISTINLNKICPNIVIPYKDKKFTLNSINYYTLYAWRRDYFNIIFGISNKTICSYNKYRNRMNFRYDGTDIPNLIVVKNCINCVPKMKQFITSKVTTPSNYIVVHDISLETFIDNIRNEFWGTQTLTDYDKYIISEIYNYAYSNIIMTIDFNNNLEYEKWKKDNKITKQKKTIDYQFQTAIFNKNARDYYWSTNKIFNNITELEQYIQGIKGAVIVTSCRDENLHICEDLCRVGKVKEVISMNKSILKMLTPQSNMTTLDAMLNENSELSILVSTICNHPVDISLITSYYRYMSKEDQKYFYYYQSKYEKYSDIPYDLKTYIKNKKYNIYDYKLVEATKRISKLSKSIFSFTDTYNVNRYTHNTLLCYLLLKSKTLKVNYDTYKELILNDPIIKLIKK